MSHAELGASAELSRHGARFVERKVGVVVAPHEQRGRGDASVHLGQAVERAHVETLQHLERARCLPRVAKQRLPSSFGAVDLSSPSDPRLVLRLRRDALRLSFLTTMTVFSAPQNVMLEELSIESYFPMDRETELACERLASES
jgi:hypothetical protein